MHSDFENETWKEMPPMLQKVFVMNAQRPQHVYKTNWNPNRSQSVPYVLVYYTRESSTGIQEDDPTGDVFDCNCLCSKINVNDVFEKLAHMAEPLLVLRNKMTGSSFQSDTEA